MRKCMALFLILALVLCAPAWAEGVTDALGITGGDVSARGDLSARTTTDLFVVTDEGSDKALMRVSREGGTVVRVEAASSISDLVAAGDILYFLRVNNGEVSLVRRNTDSTRTEVYAFASGSTVSTLSYDQGNLYVLIDGKLHIIYPSTGQCVMLSGTAMSDYAIAGDTLYYISESDKMTYETASLLGNGTLSAEAGCLYQMSLNTGSSSLLIKTGAQDLRCYNGALYFHNLSDNYVMGDESSEWIEGKLYRYDLEREQLSRLVNGYDWGFYPMDGGVAVYTSGTLSYYNDLGGLERTMYEPEALAVLSGGGDAVIVYEPTGEQITYVYADGTAVSAYDGEPGYTAPTQQTAQADATGETDATGATGAQDGLTDASAGDTGSGDSAGTGSSGTGTGSSSTGSSSTGSSSGGTGSSSGSSGPAWFEDDDTSSSSGGNHTEKDN